MRRQNRGSRTSFLPVLSVLLLLHIFEVWPPHSLVNSRGFAVDYRGISLPGPPWGQKKVAVVEK